MNTQLRVKSIATFSFLVLCILLFSCDPEDPFKLPVDPIIVDEFADARTSNDHKIEIKLDSDLNGQHDIVFKVYDAGGSDQGSKGCTIKTDDFDIQFGYRKFKDELYIIRVPSDSELKYVVFNEITQFNVPGSVASDFDEIAKYSSPERYQNKQKPDENLEWDHKLQQLSEFDQDYRADTYEGLPVQNNIIKGLWYSKDQSEIIGFLPIRHIKYKPYTYGWIKLKISEHCCVEIMEIDWEQ